MSDQAVTEPSQATPSAGEEPQVPKYRLDQLAAEIRNLRETVQIKDQAIEQYRNQMIPQARPDQEEEELLQSLDPTQLKAVKRLIGKELDAGRQEMRSYLGVMGSKLDEQNFLLKYGKEKEKLLPRIREMRREHAMKNIPLDSEAAYKFILVEEMESRASTQMEKKADPAPVKKEERKEDDPPPAKATHAKTSESKSIDELEADLDEQIRASGGKI